MESNTFGESIEYEEEFEVEDEVPQPPAAASSAKPPAVKASAADGALSSQVLTDAELDAYLDDDMPGAAAKGPSASMAVITKGDDAAYQPAGPASATDASAELETDSVIQHGVKAGRSNSRRYSRQVSNASAHSQHGHAAVARASNASDQGARLSKSGDEQGYSVEFDEGPTDEDHAHLRGHHGQQHTAAAAAADEDLEESVLSDHSSSGQVAATAASAAASYKGSHPASRHSSADKVPTRRSSHASDPVSYFATQREQSSISTESEAPVLQGAFPASAFQGSAAAGTTATGSPMFVPGPQAMQQVYGSPPGGGFEAEYPVGSAVVAAYSPWTAGAAQHAASPVARRSSSARQRPSSAGVIRHSSSRRSQQEQQQLIRSSSWQPQAAQQQVQLQEVEVLPLVKWEVRDVCDWVDGFGLPQYRKKLMHHCVDGRLLTKLTDDLLKAEVGIGPLGHRFMLLEAIQAIQSADLAAAAAMGDLPEDCSATAETAVRAAGAVAAAAMHRSSSRHTSATGGTSHAGGRYDSPNGYNSLAGGAGDGSDSSPARGRARPSSAPIGRGRGRSPSPQGSPGALGPAAGRISVYEQRAKLLFELGRAQARAATQSSTAAQVGDVARLAAEEVARLKGQLADLDRKNRLQVAHSSGSVDTRGQIPWQHVGAGTKASHPHPESIAKPWDPPDADLTFKPRISRNSQRIMAEARGESGGSGFLDRLNNDLRRRQSKMKELERRFHGNAASPGDATVASKAAAADLSLVAGFLSQRGWANIPTGRGSNSGNDMGAQQDVDEQLDEVVESYSKELNLTDAQAQAIRAARGAKKVSLLAAAVRTCQFMDRYKADLSTRDNRLQELQDKWFKQQMATGVARPGTAAPMTQEQRDMASAVDWFQGLGWGDAAEDDDCDELLTALIKRARAYKTEAEKLHDKAQAGQQPSAAQKPQINWQQPPWSSDHLNSLMQKHLDSRKAEADAVARKAAEAKRPSAVEKALQAAGTLKTPAGNTAGGDAAASSSSVSPLDHAVQLLGGMRWDSLDQLEAASGKAKKLAVYRALRTQSFLDFTAADLAAREAKQRAQWEAIEASRRGKQVSKQELEEFYKRLQEDGERRKQELEKAKSDQADRELKVLAMLRASAAASSARSTRSRPKSAAPSTAK